MFYANMDDNLRIQCRVCKGFAPASQFKLHYKYKQVVCPNCTSGKFEQEERKKAAAVAAPAEQRKPVPAGIKRTNTWKRWLGLNGKASHKLTLKRFPAAIW